MPKRVAQAEAVSSAARLAVLGRTVWIGIDGPGGAGKSTLAARIAAGVAAACVVHVDDFAGPKVQEWDWERFRAQVLLPLLAGRPARYQRWDWDRDEGAEWLDIAVGRMVVVEGVSATRTELAAPWDLSIWVQTPRGIRLERALERDGAAMLPRWLDDWMPSEQRYIAAQSPQARVDLIVSGTE